MKLLIAIFSLYILLLPTVPCNDTNECKETAAADAQCSTGNHKQHGEEACNPFCNCACCGQVITPVLQLNKPVTPKQAVQQLQYFYQDKSLSSSFLGTIWQPPRV